MSSWMVNAWGDATSKCLQQKETITRGNHTPTNTKHRERATHSGGKKEKPHPVCHSNALGVVCGHNTKLWNTAPSKDAHQPSGRVDGANSLLAQRRRLH